MGKSALAHAAARTLGAEILSIDSMQVYRGMNIGTAKATPEERSEVPYHLIDVLDPCESFSAARFVELADQAVAAVHARGRPVVAVGGTTLYFKSFHEGLFEGPSADACIREAIRNRIQHEGLEALHAELARIDPVAAARIHRNDARRVERALEVYQLTGRRISELQQQWERSRLRRPDWRWTLIHLHRERDLLNRRINERVRQMRAAGLTVEARRIWDDPRGVSPQARQAVGYAELFDNFGGCWSEDEAYEQIKIHSRRLGKQQRTWLRRIPGAHLIDAGERDAADFVQDVIVTAAKG
ncbi:MAG: tRNA (adenosine(37)-N6)-dimethylallyltransferase MiaA [Phycisphaerales bacterium]|nr:tRNA (adenosine(37)-N6)-dimethylallyltransferase MiaA [Phycisphaerales bacterium]